MRTTLVRLCAWLGFETTAVADGASGLSSLADGSYDLVLTDLRMPRASGLDVARGARAISPPPALIIVSGFANAEEEAEIRLVGANFLQKPFDIETAQKVIRDALARRSL